MMKIKLSFVSALALAILAGSALATAQANPPYVLFSGDATTAYMQRGSAWGSRWINQGQVLPPGDYWTTSEQAGALNFYLNNPHQEVDIVHIIPAIGEIATVNFANQYYDIPAMESNIREMVGYAKNANLKVILGTVAPVYVSLNAQPSVWGTQFGPDIAALNSWIEAYGAANNIPVVNYHDLLCGTTPSFLATVSYAYGCVGSTNPNQTFFNGLPYFMAYDATTESVHQTTAGSTAMDQMATIAINTISLTLEGGYLSNTYTVPLTGLAYKTNVNTVYPSSSFPIQFTPMGVYSDGVTRPIVNTNFAGASGTWASSNPNVMTINQDGTAIALDEGTSTITYAGPKGEHFSSWVMYVVTPPAP